MLQKQTDKGKTVFKISKKQLMFKKEKSESSKSVSEDVKDLQILDPVAGQVDSKSVVQTSVQVNQFMPMDSVIQHLTDTMFYIRKQDLQLKNCMMQVDMLNQEKAKLEKISAGSLKHEVLIADIDKIRTDILNSIEEKHKENAELKRQLQEAELKFMTIKEWLDEMKEKFFSELQIVAEKNVELEREIILMHNRLRVLKSVEDQLKESVEDIEVEGTFMASSDLMTLSASLTEKGQLLWDNIKTRMLHVMQRPYQMFSLKEVSEQEMQFKLANDKLINQLEHKDYELSLVLKQHAVLKHQLQMLSGKMVEKTESSDQKDNSQSNDNLNDLIHALHKFQASSELVLSFNEDWIQVSDMLKQFGVAKHSVLLQEQSVSIKAADTVQVIMPAKIIQCSSDTAEMQKEGSELTPLRIAVDAVDRVIDAVISNMDEEHIVHAEQGLVSNKAEGQAQTQTEEGT